ncbi:MAG: CHC2 zinc finger domain-containing protein, partial [Thermodesulfobacteriota bacterium]
MLNKDEILSRINKRTFYQSYVNSLKSSNSSAQGLGLCPFHDDHDPSFSVNYTEGFFNCFACGEKGDIFDFYQKLRNVDFKTALREIGKMNGGIMSQPYPKKVATFEYRCAEGKLLYTKERCEPARDGKRKEFFFNHQKNGKQKMGRGCSPVLYNQTEVAGAEVVYFVEGEGKAELLKGWGLVATSLDAGANSPWHDEYFEYIEKTKQLIIIPDNDKSGWDYAERIALELFGRVETIKIIELPGLDEKGDIIDWARIPGNDIEVFTNIIDTAPIFDGTIREKEKKDRTPNIVTLLEKTVHDRTLCPAQDYKDEVMYYAVRIDGKPYLVTSEKKIISFAQAEDKGLNLNTKFVDTFRFDPEWILDYYREGRKVKVSEVYKKTYNFIKDYIFFTSDSHGKFLSVWVIGTYIFKIFRYYPYIWLNAPKQSGKTLLMEILKELSFNGDLSSNASESAIFRDVHNNLITMFLDEVEKLSKQDMEKYGAIMTILNTGFSASGFVKRAGSQKQNFTIQRFSTFSPKAFAGIKEIDDVVQDRTIKINMLRKKPGEVAKRYKVSDALVRSQ